MVATIVAYQEKQDLTDQEVSELLNVPRSTWTAVRLGNFAPGLSFAQKVADVPRFRDVAAKVLMP